MCLMSSQLRQVFLVVYLFVTGNSKSETDCRIQRFKFRIFSGNFLLAICTFIYYALSFSFLLQVSSSQSWHQRDRATIEGNESRPISAPQMDARRILPIDYQTGKNQFSAREGLHLQFALTLQSQLTSFHCHFHCLIVLIRGAAVIDKNHLVHKDH